MATGRIGVTPVLGTRWSIEPAAGTTSLSGLDANSVSLVYSVGYEQVYRNGVLLSRGNDYTATNGTSITLTDATITGDIIEVFAQELVPLTDAISKGQFTAKGSLLSASAASTPAVLAVGTNGQVLKADSSTTTGLAWGTDSSGFSAWTTYTPTWTNLTVGNGTVSARYTQDNKVVIGTVYIQFGSTTSITANNPRFTLPVTARDPGILSGSNFFVTGAAMASDWNIQTYKVDLAFQSTTAVEFQTLDTGSAHGKYVATTTTVPITFGTSDVLMGTFIYEAA